MTKRVLDVGNCDPDHGTLSRMIQSNFDARVERAHGLDDAQAQLEREPFDLVLINRKLDRDYTDGMDVLKALKADPKTAALPMMIVSNYADAQDAAVAAGAERGFGKLDVPKPETRDLLSKFLE